MIRVRWRCTLQSLSGLHHLDGKGGVDNDALRLCRCGMPRKDIVEDAGGIFLAYAAEEFFGTGILEAEGLRTVDRS